MMQGKLLIVNPSDKKIAGVITEVKQCLAGIARSNLDNYLTLGPT